MKKTTILIIVVLVAMTAVFASGTTEKVSKDTVLRVWTFLDISNPTNGRAVVLKKAIDNFESAHPGVKVVVETQQWTTLPSKVFAANEAGDCADLFMVNTANRGEAIKRGVFEPLDNMFYGKWTDAQKEDLNSAVLEAGFDGKYNYDIPLFFGGFGLMYRKDIFREKGIDPESIKTWTDLANAAQKLTYIDANGQKVWGYGIGYSLEVVDPHGALPNALFGKAGGMFSDDGMPNDWTGSVAQQALQMEIDLIKKYKVSPESSASVTSEDIYTDFAAGKYAMISAGTVRMPTVQSQSAFNPEDIGFMPYPSIDGKSESKCYAAGWHFGVWSGSENKDIAGEFLEYICSPEIDNLWVTEAQQVPLLKSTLENSKSFFENPINTWVIDAKDIIDSKSYVQSIKFVVSGFNEDMQNAFLRVFVEGKSNVDALKSVEHDFIKRNHER